MFLTDNILLIQRGRNTVYRQWAQFIHWVLLIELQLQFIAVKSPHEWSTALQAASNPHSTKVSGASMCHHKVDEAEGMGRSLLSCLCQNVSLWRPDWNSKLPSSWQRAVEVLRCVLTCLYRRSCPLWYRDVCL